MSERNLLTTSRFLLEIDGIIQAGFSEVTIPESSVEIIQYRNGDDPSIMQNIVGQQKVTALVLKTGVTFDAAASLELANWHKDTVNGKISQKNVSIIMQDHEGREGARFNIVNGIASKYTVSPLNSKNNEIAIETLEIANEGITRVK